MRVLPRVLLGLGAFLLIAGVLAVGYAPGVVKKIPLDVNTKTVYAGQAAKIDPLTGDFNMRDVYAITYTRVDSKESSDDHVIIVEHSCAVFDTGGAQECVNGNDPDLITASQDIYALDRESAEAVEDKNLPPDAIHPVGLVTKFPFDVEKKTYPWWDGTLGRAVDIDYKGTESLFGLEHLQVLLHGHGRADRGRRGHPGHLRQHREHQRRPQDGLDRPQRPGPAALPRGRHAGPRHQGAPERRHDQGRRRRGQDQRQAAHPAAHRPSDRRLRRRSAVPARWARTDHA